ncbi:MAG: hypothetical protein HY660_11960 [Armatimonadetes bacterium]|nr:hypothetical protein [Armatimonadota bacterium]
MGRSGKPRLTKSRVRALIEEAIVDCYTEDEQHGAFLVMLEQRVICPFKALVVGEEVEVQGFNWDGTPQGILAICRRKGRTYRTNVTALQWTNRPPPGWEWFDAYRAWLKGGW